MIGASFIFFLILHSAVVSPVPCSGLSGLRGKQIHLPRVDQKVDQQIQDAEDETGLEEEDKEENGSKAEEEDDTDDEEDEEEEGDDEKHEEEDEEEDEEGYGEDKLDELEKIRRAGGKADLDGDERLSGDEMMLFAEGLLDKHRRAVTKDTMSQRDTNKDGKISRKEARAGGVSAASVPKEKAQEYMTQLFDAADTDKDNFLNREEFHGYLHPEARFDVLEVVVRTRFQHADSHPKDGQVDLEEFMAESKLGDEGGDFSAADATADFKVHDTDKSGGLDAFEYREYLHGVLLLRSHVETALKAGDEDKDGHIHLEEELPNRIKHMLDTEFVEDYFLHADHHDHHQSEL